ncbi:nickel-binding protein [Steroidobacter sp.]|uniref:nickel-binding protein n=1 Tax=Steroidobacter sp. TaxID=1978227 RepID=UPI002EDB4423
MFLERNFATPIGATEALAHSEQGAWCLEMHRVKWQGSFLATDGIRMVCWFVAPDAESVRAALAKGGLDTRRLWIGTVHEGPEPAVPNVLVERSFQQPVELAEIQAIEDAGHWCLRAHRVKFARTFFASHRKRMLCLYQAPDAESVRLAQRQAAMPMDAVWAFDRISADTRIPRSP